jgi:hypothetical protein
LSLIFLGGGGGCFGLGRREGNADEIGGPRLVDSGGAARRIIGPKDKHVSALVLQVDLIPSPTVFTRVYPQFCHIVLGSRDSFS